MSSPDLPVSQRTRSRTGAHSRSDVNSFNAPLERSQIIQSISTLQVNQTITVWWSRTPDPTIEQFHGTCVRREGFNADIAPTRTAATDDDANGEDVMSLPGDIDDGELNVFKIQIHAANTRLGLPPITDSNRSDMLNSNSIQAVIFVDGSTRPVSGGPGAAAIVVREVNGFTAEVQNVIHARHFACTTGLAATLSGFVAAFRTVNRQFKDRNVLIVTTLRQAYDLVTGKTTVKTGHTAGLCTMARQAFADDCLANTTIAYVHCAHHNPAADATKRCIQTAETSAHPGLFPDCPVVVPKPARTPAPVIVVQESPSISINTLDDFAKLRFFGTRSTVPHQSRAQWATLVKHKFFNILTAETCELRDRAIVDMFTMPSLYLPSNSSRTRIHERLVSGQPFNLDLQKASKPRRPTDSASKRLEEAVHRLAMDRRVRTANRLLQHEPDDVPFQEKVEKLQAKLVDENPAEGWTPPPIQTPANISGREVRRALGKINRQSATSIDGWSKDLLSCVVQHHPNAADDIAAICNILISQPLSPLLVDILRAARLVGVPKRQGGIRPIAIANLWLKLLGTIAMDRDGGRPSRHQYAINTPKGCEVIIHQVLKSLRDLGDGYVAVKCDLTNAFNSIKRKVVNEQLRSHDTMLQQYWRLAYGGPSPLVVFGPGTHTTLNMSEGVRQGDSTSTFFFCIAIDPALTKIAERFKAWMFCDDLTLVIRREEVDEAVAYVTQCFAEIGLTVNPSKTQIFDPRIERVEAFVLLGADLANTDEFMNEYIHRQRRYFDTLNSIRLHPQLAVCLLRLCGSPRIKYICSVMPPATTDSLARQFDNWSAAALHNILGVPIGTVPKEAIHDKLGAGIPNYTDLAPKLFTASQDFALRGINAGLELVTTAASWGATTARHNLDATWLWYDDAMTPAEFTTAFAVRLGFVPPHLRLAYTKCDCGELVTSDASQIRHSFTCDRFTRITHTTRHNNVRDAICRCAATYGITCTREPTVYTYPAGRRRPDILFHVMPTPLATDVTIVYPDGDPLAAAIAADEKKRTDHSAAVAALGHGFIPCALEAFGTFGPSATTLIATLSHTLPPLYQVAFRRDMHRAIATAMAQGRSAALYGSRWRQNLVN